MFGRGLKSGLIAAAVTGVLSVGLVAPASAAPVVFTWDPVAGGISTLTSALSAQFSANNITIADYAAINIPANPTIAGSVTETGFLGVSSFNFVGAPGFGAGFDPINSAPGGASGGATPWKLYFSFTSTSHLAPSGSGLTGAFDSLSFTLFGDKGGNCLLSLVGSTPTLGSCGTDTQVALASGVLTGGVNSVDIDSTGLPAAHVTTTFNELVPGFFVNPPSTITLTLEASFTNTESVTSGSPAGCNTSGALPCTILINGGGGNATLIGVPEPGTLSLVGFGLLGLGFFAARRRTASNA